MEQNTFSAHFIIRNDRVDKEGFVPIYAKIIINNEKVLISLNIKVISTHWDANKEEPKLKAKDYDEINKVIGGYKTKIFSVYSKLVASNKELTAENFKLAFYGIKPEIKQYLLVATAIQHNKNFESLIGIKYSYGSYKNYKSTLKYLKEFIPETYNNKDIPLTQVNFKFCEAFFHFLTTKKDCKTNGANKQLQRVKKIVNYAIKQGYINYNPMATYALQFKPVNKVALTLDEIRSISKLKLKRQTLEIVRDIFLFQCYTGIAYADVKRLSQKDIAKDLKGKIWVKMQRVKTQTAFSVPLLPQAVEILNKYLPKEMKTPALLPVLSNQKMNENLKIIQELAGISKSLTTHLARHTFATTITLGNGVPIETVSKMLGHTKLSTTQIYAKVLDEKIDKDMERLKDKLR